MVNAAPPARNVEPSPASFQVGRVQAARRVDVDRIRTVGKADSKRLRASSAPQGSSTLMTATGARSNRRRFAAA